MALPPKGVVIRLATRDEAILLPTVEKSAAQAFRRYPRLAFVAEGAVLPVASHHRCVEAMTCWVAVAETGGPPVGFLSATVLDADMHVLEMSVAAEWQGRGIGRALLAACRDDATARRLRAVTLTTFRDVPWNAPFYRRQGFRFLSEGEEHARLRADLAAEAADGLAVESRCAMVLPLRKMAY
ncbi:acetyltransferase [Neoasaia chiangmaiensis NBRC 101099]|nr:GNAT family N-acetyltransferase [Neoasaia chiangmaiensis]GBR38761.1 acetyltransferase [Neoasaia chiangmaiensis NBRC 101099]GEN15736.1 acetyltransferase [Neoasaia chiangmaiensis]